MIISKWRYELQLKRAEDRGRREAMEEMAETADLRDRVHDLEIEVGILRRKVCQLLGTEGSECDSEEPAADWHTKDLPY